MRTGCFEGLDRGMRTFAYRPCLSLSRTKPGRNTRHDFLNPASRDHLLKIQNCEQAPSPFTPD